MICTHSHRLRLGVGIVSNAKKRSANPLRSDPTRTVMIRKAFIAEINRRFRKLRLAVLDFILTQDALALDDKTTRLFETLATRREFEFRTDAGKLEAFNAWFKQQVEADVFSVPAGVDLNAPWTAKYVESAYKRGLINSYFASKQADLFEDGEAVSQEAFLRQAFNQPEVLSKVRLLATRTLENLRGVTATMGSQMNQILAQGMIDGLGAAAIAREMAGTIDGLTRSRALMIARTEIINAHSEGQLDAYEELGVEELGVRAEWSTAGDDRVCPQCMDMEGKVFTLDKARGLIPLHPNCVLGDSVIELHDCLAVTRAKYFGKVLTISTAAGRTLSVTENHILLTQRGWVRAKELLQSDQLINATSLYGSTIQAPDNHNGKQTIEQVFQFLSKTHLETRMTIPLSSTKDFHNDGSFMHEEIDVVFTDGLLRKEAETFDLSNPKKLVLMRGSVSSTHANLFAGRSSANHLLHRHASSPYSGLSSPSVPFVLQRCAFGHLQLVGLSVGANGNSTVKEPSSNSPTVATMPFGQLLNTLTSEVVFDQILDIDFSEPFWRGVFVFDVWSHSSAYMLEGLVSSNCRCAWIPAAEDLKIPEE